MFKKKTAAAAPTPEVSAVAQAAFEPTPDMFEKLDDASKNAEKISYESKTYFKDAWGRFKKNKMAMTGLVFLCIMIVLCIFVPIFSPYTYDGQDLSSINACLLYTSPSPRDTR